MYAIVEINGQQFKAEAGKKLFVHHIQNAENGATVEFDKVLLVDKDGNITVGARCTWNKRGGYLSYCVYVDYDCGVLPADYGKRDVGCDG